MRLWIDADAAPREVKEIVFRPPPRLGLEMLPVANQALAIPPGVTGPPSVLSAGGPAVRAR